MMEEGRRRDRGACPPCPRVLIKSVSVCLTDTFSLAKGQSLAQWPSLKDLYPDLLLGTSREALAL